MNLYIYKGARPHSHDLDAPYYNTTPFSIEGIKKHCTVVSNKERADFYYMGQISEAYDELVPPIKKEDFGLLDECPKKHILDLEGDWFSKNAPDWVTKCIKSGNATKKENYVQPFCVRPCFSYLLLYLGKNKVDYELEFPDDVSFGFCGFPDPLGIRFKMARCANSVSDNNQILFNNGWYAKKDVDSVEVKNYIQVLLNNLISLCPRGMGTDTIRFYESCFFGRVPVVISEMAIVGEHYYDTSFIYRISPTLSERDMTYELNKIYNTPHSELVARGKLARKYFDDVILEYFKDPTLYFINFLKKSNLYEN